AGQEPQGPDGAPDAGDRFHEDPRAQRRRHLGHVGPRVLEGPEPELPEHARPGQEQAGQRERKGAPQKEPGAGPGDGREAPAPAAVTSSNRRRARTNSSNAVARFTSRRPRWMPRGVCPRTAMMAAYAAYVPGSFML